jgi:hypothetical protein
MARSVTTDQAGRAVMMIGAVVFARADAMMALTGRSGRTPASALARSCRIRAQIRE